jgi:hypothetical protein
MRSKNSVDPDLIAREKMISVLRTWRLGKKHKRIKTPR